MPLNNLNTEIVLKKTYLNIADSLQTDTVPAIEKVIWLSEITEAKHKQPEIPCNRALAKSLRSLIFIHIRRRWSSPMATYKDVIENNYYIVTHSEYVFLYLNAKSGYR